MTGTGRILLNLSVLLSGLLQFPARAVGQSVPVGRSYASLDAAEADLISLWARQSGNLVIKVKPHDSTLTEHRRIMAEIARLAGPRARVDSQPSTCAECPSKFNDADVPEGGSLILLTPRRDHSDGRVSIGFFAFSRDGTSAHLVGRIGAVLALRNGEWTIVTGGAGPFITARKGPPPAP